MIYIGIDPAVKKKHAYSIWEDSTLVGHGKIEFIGEFYKILDEYDEHEVEVLIEDQYLHNNYKTSKELSFRSGMLAGICELIGIKYSIVNVATWTSKWGGYKDVPKDLSAYKRKKFKAQLLKDYVEDRFAYTVKDEDEASAILIPFIMRVH